MICIHCGSFVEEMADGEYWCSDCGDYVMTEEDDEPDDYQGN